MRYWKINNKKGPYFSLKEFVYLSDYEVLDEHWEYWATVEEAYLEKPAPFNKENKERCIEEFITDNDGEEISFVEYILRKETEP